MDDQKRIAIAHFWERDNLNREVQNSELNANKTRYQYENHLGSASLELDNQGQIISYEEYFPYGGTSFIAGTSQSEVKLKEYRYTGKERDDTTGLYYYGARYYAPWLGRWLSTEPLLRNYQTDVDKQGRRKPLRFINYKYATSFLDTEIYSIEAKGDKSNGYLYSKNNPISFVDAYGLKPKDFLDKLGNWLQGEGWKTDKEVEEEKEFKKLFREKLEQLKTQEDKGNLKTRLEWDLMYFDWENMNLNSILFESDYEKGENKGENKKEDNLKFPNVFKEGTYMTQGYEGTFSHIQYKGKLYGQGIDVASKGNVWEITWQGPGEARVEFLPEYNKKGEQSSYGNRAYVYFTVKDAEGNDINYRILLAHLDASTNMKNRTLKLGDVIGYMGTTGKSTGIHTHMEVHIKTSKGWINVNPTDYFNLPAFKKK